MRGAEYFTAVRREADELQTVAVTDKVLETTFVVIHEFEKTLCNIELEMKSVNIILKFKNCEPFPIKMRNCGMDTNYQLLSHLVGFIKKHYPKCLSGYF